jgi:hypothetical protein
MSSFENWAAYDIVGPLSKAEVKAALLDYGFERKRFRTWDSIEELVLTGSDEVKNVLYQSAVAKRNVEEQHCIELHKRRLEDQKMQRNVRRRIGLCSYSLYKN